MSARAAILPTPPRARVLLADKAGFSRTALARVLAETPCVELVGVTAGEPELGDALARLRPDVLIIDDRLLRNGRRLSLVAGLRAIVVGVDDDPAYAARAADQGALAWLPKERADLLITALLETADVVGKYGAGRRAVADDGPRNRA
jgi:DNA-binding NarL/FixJ family response regulator